MNPTQQKVYDDATKAAQSAAQSIGGTYTPEAGYKPITSESLKPAEAVKLPEAPKPNTYIPDVSGLAQVDPYAMTDSQKSAQNISDKILADMELQQTAQKEKAGMELAQINPLQAQETQLINEQNALINEQKAITGNIQNEFAGKGATAGGVSPFEMAAKRKNLQDIYLNQAKLDAVRGNITSAQNYINKSLEAKYGDIQANLDYKIKALGVIQASPAYTLSEKKQAAAAQAQEQAKKDATDKKKEDEKTIQALALATYQNYPNDVQAQLDVKKATESGDIMKALSILGKYQKDPQEIRSKILDEQYKAKQMSLIDAQISKTLADAKETTEAKATAQKMANLDPNSPTFTMDMVRSSSGGKTPTGEQTKPINKASLVLSQLQDLQSEISKANTGPILGILRDNNPYDVKAQLIKAQLQAITPNLARGVYGEVGVLTDNDIKNYIQTLPNLKKTTDANNLVLGMTLKVLKNSVDSNLQVLAAEGRDVSGFEPILTRFDNKISEIDRKMGGSVQTGRLTDGTIVTKNADGSITDAKGNRYDENGNKIK